MTALEARLEALERRLEAVSEFVVNLHREVSPTAAAMPRAARIVRAPLVGRENTVRPIWTAPKRRRLGGRRWRRTSRTRG